MNATRLNHLPDEIRARLAERISDRSGIPDQNGCINWTGPLDRAGYAKFSVSHKLLKVYTSAHRVAWMLVNGDIREGLVLDHICRNRSCVNPSHLQLVTQTENIRCGAIPVRNREALGLPTHRPTKAVSERDHCVNGHEWVPENIATYTTKSGGAEIRCRPCRRAQNRKYRVDQQSGGIAPSPDYQRGKYAA